MVAQTDSRTPFTAVLADHAPDLPLPFREQFLLSAEADYEMVLTGRMDEVWQRPRWLKPLFHLLARFDMLFPETGRGVPAEMIVSGGTDQYQTPIQHWNRTFSFPAVDRRFDAVMAVDAQRDCVVEKMGPGNCLEMGWEIVFRPPNKIHIITTDCYLRWGRWLLPLPAFAYPVVRAEETALTAEPARIHVDLTVSHPWFGPIFGYNGTFQMEKRPISSPSL